MRPRSLAAVSAFLLFAAAGWLFWDTWSREHTRQAGTAALQAARDSIPAILSYQPTTAQQQLTAAARDRLTGKFLDDYTQLITTVVVPDATQKSVSATARVPAAAVVSASGDHAVVLAYVDQTTTEGRQPPVQSNSSVRVSMDRVDGRWLISGFEPV